MTYENFDWHTFIRGIQALSDRVDWERLTNDQRQKVERLKNAKGCVDTKDNEYFTLSDQIHCIEIAEDDEKEEMYNEFVKYKELIQTLPKKALQQTPPKKALQQTPPKKSVLKTIFDALGV
jgi:CO dehydrogenase/acetyl-CoA synthase beta subunit